ncbi:MAG: hypothetical protein RLO17_08770 [Cyclobacteriaceae bacterium]
MKRSTLYRSFILLTIIGTGTYTNILISTRLWDNQENPPNIEHQVQPTKTDEISPFIEYENLCEGLENIRAEYPFREIQGFISDDNSMILTAVGSIYKVVGPKPIFYEGKYYLAWNKLVKPSHSYSGVIQYKGSDYLFIPVKAMFHSHVIDGALSKMDLQTAKKLSRLRHLLIKNDQIIDFNEFGPKSTQHYSEKACQYIAFR